ncbi:MAG: ABC transporter ATP-binding protein [Rhodospirillales bacterium]|nr:ABC transporter ATP-binding protein [Rhodospirillales bacterium]
MTLVLDQVTRSVGTEIHIRSTSLELTPGSVNTLLGPTLSGKTTLMRLMCGLDRPSSGRVLADGVDVTGRSVRERDVAMVYQQFINYPSFTVYDNIASPLKRGGMARDEIDRKVRQIADVLRIGPLLDRLPGELSGGQQQRTALARALVKEAGLLLLDEPLVNLDYKLREELRQELRTIFETGKSIVIYATTEPLEALMLGGNTVVLDEGRVLQTGPTIEVHNAPASERVGAVFSDPPINMIDGVVDNGSAVLGGGIRIPLKGHLRGLAMGRYRFGVRASYLYVSRRSADDIEFTGKVELAEISGSETFIHVAHHGVSWVAQEEGVHGFALNQEVRVYVNPGALFVFDGTGRLVAAPDRGGATAGKEAANG